MEQEKMLQKLGDIFKMRDALKIFILIITFVIIAGGIFYWQRNNISALLFGRPKICTQEAKLCPDGSYVGRTGPNCEFAQCPEAKKDETVDWKTYSAEDFVVKYKQDAYNFSLKYPPDWKPMEHDYGTGFDVSFLSSDYRSPEKDMYEEILEGGKVFIMIVPNQNIRDLKSWFDSYFYDPIEKKVIAIPQPVSIMIGNEKQVDGLEFIGGTGMHAKLFAIGNTVYVFYAMFQGEEKAPKYLEVLDQMLSTFKFIR